MDRRRAAPRPGAPRHPAAWLADPAGRHELRYWDGREWTVHVSDGGIPATDPVTSGAGLPVPRWIVPVAAGDRLIPSGAPTGSRRRLWPGLLVAATAILVGVIVAGTGATRGPARPATRLVRRSTPAATAGPTVVTTLPIPECQRIVLEVQAGLRAMTAADYRRACGDLPAGVALGPATTPATGAFEGARRP